MTKNILVVLHGTPEDAVKDAYQVLQRDAAAAEGERAGFAVEITMVPGWDQLRVIRKRLGDSTASPLDAVVVEPVSVGGMDLILQAVDGRCGLVFTNAWDAVVERSGARWSARKMPLGTVTVDYKRIGEIQARQVAALLPRGGEVLYVTGPLRATSVADRCAGFRAHLPAGIAVHEASAGNWLEADGAAAFDGWYRLGQSRALDVQVVAAHSDELAMGVRQASQAVANPEHRAMFSVARVLGADACPGFGQRLVDSGQLAASVITPATTGAAILHLRRFWESGEPVPLRGYAEGAKPYPASSVGD